MANKKRKGNSWLWLWIGIGFVSGLVAFGPVGAVLGTIGGLYIGNTVMKEIKKGKR